MFLFSIKKIYRKTFGRVVAKIKQRRHEKWLSENTKHISISVREVFFQHNSPTEFKRYDMIVRLLAVEEYFGKNSCGFDFYRRMQSARMGEKWSKEADPRFKALIESYEKNGYNEDSEIELDKNLNLLDGSHRMALAMYYGLDKIHAIVRPYVQEVFYGIEWFYVNGFSLEECSLLQTKYREIHDSYMCPFICTLWNPVYEYFDEITQHLSLFGKVVEVKDFTLCPWDYKFFTRGIYAVDDIAKWKIEKKIKYMLDDTTEECHLRMIAIEIEEPNFRLKDATNGTLSRKCELVKKLIRDAYSKRIKNYFYDNVMHIGDNFYQNRYIYRLLTMPQIDVACIIDKIQCYPYVISKFTVPYMPNDFPLDYPKGKDIDIICLNEVTYQEIVNTILKESQRYENEYSIHCINDTNYQGAYLRTQIRYQQGPILVFMFEIYAPKIENEDPFVENIIKERHQERNFFITTIRYELLIRLKEIHQHPNKLHHIKYVKEHNDAIDESLCDKYLDFNWRELIDKIKYERP